MSCMKYQNFSLPTLEIPIPQTQCVLHPGKFVFHSIWQIIPLLHSSHVIQVWNHPQEGNSLENTTQFRVNKGVVSSAIILYRSGDGPPTIGNNLWHLGLHVPIDSLSVSFMDCLHHSVDMKVTFKLMKSYLTGVNDWLPSGSIMQWAGNLWDTLQMMCMHASIEWSVIQFAYKWSKGHRVNEYCNLRSICK